MILILGYKRSVLRVRRVAPFMLSGEKSRTSKNSKFRYRLAKSFKRPGFVEHSTCRWLCAGNNCLSGMTDRMKKGGLILRRSRWLVPLAAASSVALFPLRALAQPYVPTVTGGAAVVGPPVAAPPAPLFPFTGGDLMLASMGIGVALIAAGLGGRYLIYRRSR